MLVLGIESSCDDTGVALYDSEVGLIDHVLFSQIATHAIYGGVVPELASRDHIQKLLPLIKRLLLQTAHKLDDIQGIAYTRGPGLSGALLVGAAFAQSLAFARKLPCLGVHHIEGHLLSPLLESDRPSFPFLALIVSGGHTLLVNVQALGVYQVLGESLDDAAGEAFDKTAKLMGLAYPGGPLLARLAKNGDPTRYRLPRPLLNRSDLMFSFSGLKTAVAQLIAKEDLTSAKVQADIAASFQAAVVDVLVTKTLSAVKQTGLTQVVVSGGVSANSQLRAQLLFGLQCVKAKVFYPRIEFCTDNGAMIAFTGCLRLQAGDVSEQDFSVKPRWSLNDLSYPFGATREKPPM